MNRHDLKIWPEYFEAVLSGSKTFEIRENDRNFCVGDFIDLREYVPTLEVYTGRRYTGTITYMTDYGQKPGFVVFSFKWRNPVQ